MRSRCAGVILEASACANLGSCWPQNRSLRNGFPQRQAKLLTSGLPFCALPYRRGHPSAATIPQLTTNAPPALQPFATDSGPDSRPSAFVVDAATLKAPLVHAEAPALSRLAPAEGCAGDVYIADLSALLSAVTTRLLSMAEDGPLVSQHAGRQLTVSLLRDNIRECACALDQLHRTLSHEMVKTSTPKLDAFQEQAALARQPVDLNGTAP